MKNVEKQSWAFDFLRLIGWAIHRSTNRHVTISGLENIPKNEPIIFAPNHQNALIDSLSILFTSFYQIVFLGRADIFKNKFFAKVLTFFKVVPIYRIRDGKDSLSKNQEVFDTCVRILNNKRFIGIYPEGQHINIKSMGLHKKAIPRIVFLAGEKSNYTLNIKIVPVGINYSHYYSFRRDLTVNYGTPLSSFKYYEILKEQGENKATIQFRDDLFESIKKLVIHVPDKKYYDLYDQAFDIFRPEYYSKLGIKNNSKYFFEAEQKLTQKIHAWISDHPNKVDAVFGSAQKYKDLKNQLNFSEYEIRKGTVGFLETIKVFLIALLFIPFGLYGSISNGWLFYLTRYPYQKNIKDKQFYSSIAFGLGFFLYPVWFIIHFFILNAFIANPLISVVVVIFSFPSGIIAWELGQLILRTAHRFKINKLTRSRNKRFLELMKLRKELIEFYDSVIL